jgi:hypothetical protein
MTRLNISALTGNAYTCITRQMVLNLGCMTHPRYLTMFLCCRQRITAHTESRQDTARFGLLFYARGVMLAGLNELHWQLS